MNKYIRITIKNNFKELEEYLNDNEFYNAFINSIKFNNIVNDNYLKWFFKYNNFYNDLKTT